MPSGLVARRHRHLGHSRSCTRAVRCLSLAPRVGVKARRLVCKRKASVVRPPSPRRRVASRADTERESRSRGKVSVQAGGGGPRTPVLCARPPPSTCAPLSSSHGAPPPALFVSDMRRIALQSFGRSPGVHVVGSRSQGAFFAPAVACIVKLSAYSDGTYPVASLLCCPCLWRFFGRLNRWMIILFQVRLGRRETERSTASTIAS